MSCLLLHHNHCIFSSSLFVVVSELEFIKFMLVSMRKIDGELFDDLRHRFEELDSTGDGKITKEDILCSARKKATTVKNKLILMEYKVSPLIYYS